MAGEEPVTRTETGIGYFVVTIPCRNKSCRNLFYDICRPICPLFREYGQAECKYNWQDDKAACDLYEDVLKINKRNKLIEEEETELSDRIKAEEKEIHDLSEKMRQTIASCMPETIQ